MRITTDVFLFMIAVWKWKLCCSHSHNASVRLCCALLYAYGGNECACMCALYASRCWVVCSGSISCVLTNGSSWEYVWVIRPKRSYSIPNIWRAYSIYSKYIHEEVCVYFPFFVMLNSIYKKYYPSVGVDRNDIDITYFTYYVGLFLFIKLHFVVFLFVQNAMMSEIKGFTRLDLQTNAISVLLFREEGPRKDDKHWM